MKKLKHIVEYILFIIFTRLLRCFSMERSASMCAFAARKIGPYLKVSDVARKNMRNALGEEFDIDKNIDNLWDNYGRFIGEFPFIGEISKEDLDNVVSLKGLENIKEFQEKKQPFILCAGHFANWDVMVQTKDKIYPEMAVIYRPANNTLVDKEILKARSSQKGITTVAKGREGARDLVKAIKSKKTIVMLVDQKMNDGIEVPFFDRPAMTAHAIARFSLQYNYPIIPIQVIRQGRSSKFELILHPELKYKSEGDMEKDCYNIMLKINKMLERWVRQNPGQWFWFHNRWKK